MSGGRRIKYAQSRPCCGVVRIKLQGWVEVGSVEVELIVEFDFENRSKKAFPEAERT